MAFSLKNGALFNAVYKTAKVAESETMIQHTAARTGSLKENDHSWLPHSIRDCGAATQENDHFLSIDPNWLQLVSIPQWREEPIKFGLPNMTAPDWFAVNGSGR